MYITLETRNVTASYMHTLYIISSLYLLLTHTVKYPMSMLNLRSKVSPVVQSTVYRLPKVPVVSSSTVHGPCPSLYHADLLELGYATSDILVLLSTVGPGRG